MKIVEAHPFHVTRNSDIEIQELEALDLLETMEESVRRRRFGKVVRLLVEKEMPDLLKDILVTNLNMDPKDVYILPHPLTLSGIKIKLPASTGMIYGTSHFCRLRRLN